MKSKEFVDTMHRILKKVGLGYMVVSDDPDCEPDIGVSSDGYIIVEKEKTILRLSDLEVVKYYADDEMDIDEDEVYVRMGFSNGYNLYYDFNMLWWELRNGMWDCGNSCGRTVLFSVDEITENGLVIKDSVLLGYYGCAKEIEIPEGITKIEEDTFRNYDLETVVLPSTLKEICDFAFCATKIKIIDLKNVEIIGKNAFRGTKLESITLPKTLKKIGNGAFAACSVDLENNILNESPVEVVDDFFK